jgi:aryl-alcohol dehydrogenase-like predicted oxidoreductase
MAGKKEMSGSRLALGSAQFGLDYGIKNARGRIPEPEIIEIVRLAREAGIDTIDTAFSYGGSEEAIGAALLGNGSQGFKIVSKFPRPAGRSLRWYLDQTLSRLKRERIYAYLYHDFQSFEEDRSSYGQLAELKVDGLVEKIGFSIYSPTELETIFRSGVEPDLIQFPLNVLDQRFLRWIPELAARHCEVHVRSVFLQGLLLMDPQLIPGRLAAATELLQQLRECAREEGLALERLLLAFVLGVEGVSRVIVGIDGKQDLITDIAQSADVSRRLTIDFARFACLDENIILPTNWKE